jgi:hypothetical protein
MHNIGQLHGNIENELAVNGFHILNKVRAQIPGNYPNPFPHYPPLLDIEVGATYVIRLFVKLATQGTARIDSGMLDVRIREKSDASYIGVIETTLPANFPLHKGDRLTLTSEHILFRQTCRPDGP